MQTKLIFSTLLFLLFFSFSLQAQNLCQAVSNRDLILAASLLNAGEDPNQADPSGNTPLLIASVNGDPDMATLLLDNGADVNLAGPGAKTPLMHAASLGFITLVDLYLNRQADPLMMDNQQMNAFDHAAESNAVANGSGSAIIDPDAVFTRLQLEMNP